MPTDLEKSIIRTLAFFDIFNYPLTELELFKWLYKPSSLAPLVDIRVTLAKSQWLSDKISQREGFYSLAGRENIYLSRKANNNLVEAKFKKVVRLVKVYRFLPFVRMIAICNSLAYSNANRDSDIDLFIIAKRGQIWLARFFTIIIIKLLGQRPEAQCRRDTFCLSFFIDEDELDITKGRLHKEDIYYPYWVSQLLPVYNPDGLYEKFLLANSWHHQYLPQAYANQFLLEVSESVISRFWSKFIGFILYPPFLGFWLYDFYRHWQVKIIDRNLQKIVNIDTRVIVSETMLKFYPNDRRELFHKKWQERIANL